MSVINQMLRDLEQRKATEAVDSHYIDEVNIVAKKQFNLSWIVLSGVLLIAIIMFFLLSEKNVSETQQAKNLQILPTEISEIVTEVEASAISSRTVPSVPILKTMAKTKPVQIRLTDSGLNVPENKTKEVLEETATEKELPVIKAQKTAITIAYKQPSVKTKVILKSEPTKKKVQKKSIVSANIAMNAKVISSSPPSVRVKSVAQKKTREQVIHQARQVMAADQSAAIKILEKNITTVSPDANYYSLLANLQQRRHQYDESIIYYRKALDVADFDQVNKGELWIGIALAYRGTGEENNAMQAFKQAIRSENISSELRQYASQQIRIY
ncbi:tetratricopeptide repeat protein [sulfur-oxidizing endosymbiont of Gigantopelta aegis]|uniref:tetratricopeptide repeat protein n=1 Tax=sulfur-oxidizing endosymbiont of Gigantopelta aegis TaxID=2794934 RepID=UPI0018DCA8CE|nr:tetratricopeptide repeat protein [sulfur-oxidizing endosymbiont of Gigantopelta aegis]